MSSPLPVVSFPDVEQVACAHLRNTLPVGTYVGTEWPPELMNRLATGVVAVTRGGGATVVPLVTEDVTLDIDVLAATKAQAHSLAQLVRGHVFAAEGQPLPNAQIYRVRDVSLVWLPHQPSAEIDQIPRYVLVMEMRVRPV
ncbi:hypothetical protein EAO71_37155 [Streptomyces sp. ms191]|uniref:hypothetical protein n=1 Tax=Streptomyces sp. ms191 TaxID=1827978 RepID=UPI0011CD5AF5|nr:hypothetical protein [Streptomyces sp. ms191]TXS08231.1 hypothetical protein EAO71_37155 [Streptomyces sp. ms191]